MKCEVCGFDVPSERVEACELMKRPITHVECSMEGKAVVMPVYSHKTAPEMVIVPNSREALRRAGRANKRSR